jgi:hypothetical protein
VLRAFPSVRERQPTILLVGLPVDLSLDSLAAVLHAKPQTQLPTLHAMAVRNCPMKSLSPWHTNAAVCAPAFIKPAATRQSW